MYSTVKPKLDATGQIAHLESKGVKFCLNTKEAALVYLSQNNNYFKLTAYRKHYPKHPDGECVGTYIDLDFAYLKDLAIIDMRFRYVLMQMALDVEHFAKIKLLKSIEASNEDGYSIVREYREGLDYEANKMLNAELRRNIDSPYCGDIIQKYAGDYPIWAFVEVIPFGRFVSFYKFCADTLKNSNMLDEHYLLLRSKGIRNAAAHNNCVLNDLSPGTSKYKSQYCVTRNLGLAGIPKEIHTKKMSNARIQQIVTLLYTHKNLVTSAGIHNNRCEMLNDVVLSRMFHHIDYYKNNDNLRTSLEFLKVVVDSWFHLQYNEPN